MFTCIPRSAAALLVAACVALPALSGCALFKQTPKPAPAAPAARPVDPRAQQHYYDLGLKQYSAEQYPEAERSFQQVIDNGPSTALGLKAQENLKKVQQILRTLEEMRSK